MHLGRTRGMTGSIAAPVHQDLAGAEEADAGGHTLNGAAAGGEIRPGRQHHQAGAQSHQHVHAHPVWLRFTEMLSTVVAHRHTAEHGQAHAQQSLEIGGELQRPSSRSPIVDDLAKGARIGPGV